MPKHSLLRLTQKLHGVPHLVDRRTFNNISSYLNSRNTNMMTFPMDNAPAEEDEPDSLAGLGGVGVISMSGPLTNKATGWESMCGGCSYEGIIEQASDLIAEGASCLVLDMDSGGGEAYGAFLGAQQLRSMCDDAGIPLYGYIDGTCASACFAWAVVCDEIIANPYAEVGSVGVLIALCDTHVADEMAGISTVFISAGAQKIPYAEDGSFRPEFLADLQTKVDSLYDAFASHVSTYTGLSVEAVKATEAGVYMAQDALNVGFINKIMSNVEFVNYIASIHRSS